MEDNVLRPRVDKVFFAAGDLVIMKHDLAHRPVMVVQTVDKMPVVKGDRPTALLGVTCLWFSSDMVIQKHRFSTKDIEKYTPE